jgi:hypothetical protein
MKLDCSQRFFCALYTGTVYHPPSADNKRMLDYLLKSLGEIDGRYPNCGTSDQEILIVSTLVGFHILARNKDQVLNLDLVLTNMFQYYMAMTL